METDYREIRILRGIPGSGKSTYADILVKEGWKRINKDDLRTMINGYSLDNSDETMIHEIQGNIIKMMMGFGRNIVIDNTHARWKYVRDLERLITKQQQWMLENNVRFDYTVKTVLLDVPIEICKERNKNREKPVFEEVINKMHKQLRASSQESLDFRAIGHEIV